MSVGCWLQAGAGCGWLCTWLRSVSACGLPLLGLPGVFFVLFKKDEQDTCVMRLLVLHRPTLSIDVSLDAMPRLSASSPDRS